MQKSKKNPSDRKARIPPRSEADYCKSLWRDYNKKIAQSVRKKYRSGRDNKFNGPDK